jgi:hypothetical protein
MAASGNEALHESYFVPRRNLPPYLFKRLPWFTGHLDRGEPAIEHRAQNFDELAIGVGMRLRLRADPGQGGWQVPVLEGVPPVSDKLPPG